MEVLFCICEYILALPSYLALNQRKGQIGIETKPFFGEMIASPTKYKGGRIAAAPASVHASHYQ